TTSGRAVPSRMSPGRPSRSRSAAAADMSFFRPLFARLSTGDFRFDYRTTSPQPTHAADRARPRLTPGEQLRDGSGAAVLGRPGEWVAVRDVVAIGVILAGGAEVGRTRESEREITQGDGHLTVDGDGGSKLITRGERSRTGYGALDVHSVEDAGEGDRLAGLERLHLVEPPVHPSVTHHADIPGGGRTHQRQEQCSTQ